METRICTSESCIQIYFLIDLGPADRTREKFWTQTDLSETHTSSIFACKLSVLGELKAKSINTILSLTPLYNKEGDRAVQVLLLNPFPVVCMMFGLLPKQGINQTRHCQCHVGAIIFYYTHELVSCSFSFTYMIWYGMKTLHKSLFY